MAIYSFLGLGLIAQAAEYLNWCLEIHLKCTNNRIGTCITHLTDSDTIKNGSILIQIPELVQPYLKPQA